MKFKEYLEEKGIIVEPIYEVKVRGDEIPNDQIKEIGLGMKYYKVEDEMVFLTKGNTPIAVFTGGKTMLDKKYDKKKDVKAEIEKVTKNKYYRLVSKVT